MPRQTAVSTLHNILSGKEFFAEHKDNAFVNMLVLTALRHLVFIQKTLKIFAPKKIKNAFAATALYTAVAEVLYMDSPGYAVINSYVEIIKKKSDKYIAGFANAVLRKIVAQKDEILQKDAGIILPPAFVKILQNDYPKSVIKRIGQSLLSEPAVDISVKSDADLWASITKGKALDDKSVRLPLGVKITALEGFKEGKWWVQDFAASLAVKTLVNIDGKTALDICAAPGGKTAQLIASGAITTALDISAPRLERLEENLSRLGFKTHKTICADGIEYLKTTDDKYDIILLDAPCSATGTARRHPEVLHTKSLDDVKKQAALQEEFLQHVSRPLKNGGVLVYCVCSISHIEGEKQIEKFLQRNRDFVLEESIRTIFMQDTDAFYIARLRKEQA